MIHKLKGTEDILPQEIYQWQYVEDTARDLLDLYHFQEIRTPIFESIDLFARGVGNTTDIVNKEMYDFQDKGGRHIALRPELTASVVRAFIENKLFGPEHPQPLKVYYMGPTFRYERPQAGRQRQFHQLGVEVLGSTHPGVDVEGIALAWHFFQELGLSNLTIYLNSLGKVADRQKYRQALIDYFVPLQDQLSEDSRRRLHANPLRILDSKDEQDKVLVKDAPIITDYLSPESRAHFKAVTDTLDLLAIPYQLNPYIVRGLDYYQDTIFEIMVEDNAIGAQSTVCGGGRYDGLVEMLDGPSSPGFGFAIGMERLILLLNQQNAPVPEPEGLDIYIMAIGQQADAVTFQILQAARHAGLAADRDYMGRSMKSQFKTADKYKTQLILTVGDEEIAAGTVQLKNQQTGKQTMVAMDELMQDFMQVYRKNTMDTSVIDDFFGGE